VDVRSEVDILAEVLFQRGLSGDESPTCDKAKRVCVPDKEREMIRGGECGAEYRGWRR
jgi:hypothetical protein